MLIIGPFGGHLGAHMNLAIDSHPLNQNIHQAYDYSALQVLSLDHEPLYKAIESYESKDNHLKITLKNDNAAQFLHSLEKLSRSNVFLRKLIFKNILSAKAQGRKLELKVSHNFDIKDLRLPNIAIKKRNKAHKLSMVKSPAHNHELFESGEIDFLCDTAVDLKKLDASYGSHWTGLIGSLDYSSAFVNRRDFRKIKTIIESYRPSEKFNSLDPLYLDSKLTERLTLDTEITLAFDDFYPNYEIICELALYLRDFGIKSKIVKDNYYNPCASYDLKFMITRPMGDSCAYNWLWLFSFSDAVNIRKRKRILNHLKNRDNFNFNQAVKLELGFPLFRIPSLFKRKNVKNPLNYLLGGLYELER